jgi:cell division protein FtsW (lipid II flippase)
LFTPGHPKSWFNIFGFAFQPSEFSKIGFFLLLAIFLSHYQLDLINPYLFNFFINYPFALSFFNFTST